MLTSQVSIVTFILTNVTTIQKNQKTSYCHWKEQCLAVWTLTIDVHGNTKLHALNIVRFTINLWRRWLTLATVRTQSSYIYNQLYLALHFVIFFCQINSWKLFICCKSDLSWTGITGEFTVFVLRSLFFWNSVHFSKYIDILKHINYKKCMKVL